MSRISFLPHPITRQSYYQLVLCFLLISSSDSFGVCQSRLLARSRQCSHLLLYTAPGAIHDDGGESPNQNDFSGSSLIDLVLFDDDGDDDDLHGVGQWSYHDNETLAWLRDENGAPTNIQDYMSDDEKDETESSRKDKKILSLEELMEDVTTKQSSPVASDIAYFYLRNDVGISEEVLWRLTTEESSVLGMTATNLRKKVKLMKRLMDLTDDDIRTMIMRHPAVLHLSAKSNVAPTILFLQRSLDLSREDLRSILVKFPSVLGYSLSNLKSKINFYLKLCRFTKEESRELFVAEPRLLTSGVRTGLIPRLHFFVGDVRLGWSLESFRKVVLKCPQILLCSVPNNLTPKVHGLLIGTLGMTAPQVERILTAYPYFLRYNLENHVQPIIQYFLEDLSFGPTELKSILLKFPRLVTWSLFKIKHVVGYVRFELGMDASQVKRVLYQAPTIINWNTEETLKPKIARLQKELDLDDGEMRKLVAGMPTVCICSLESNLLPKIVYLREILGPRELKQSILVQPTLLGYSLDKRIRPRMDAILGANVHPRAITVGIPMKDQAFALWLNGRRAKALAEPGFDEFRKVRTDDGILLPEFPKPKKKSLIANDASKGRVVHWTRERKPRK